MCHNRGTLMAYVDGELPPADALEVADHLRACSRCREEEAELRALAGMVDRHLAAYAAALNADGFDVLAAWERMRARVHQAPRPHWFHRPWISIVAMAAVICLVFGIGTGLRQFGPGHRLPPLASSESAPDQGVAGPRMETAPAETTDARGKLDHPESEVPGQRQEFYLMAEESPRAADSQVSAPAPRGVQREAVPEASAKALSPPEGVRQPARAGNGQDGDMVRAFSVPVLTRDLVLGAKFGKDEEGVRPITLEEIDQVVQWLTTARRESYSEEPPPLEELRIDLKDGRQIAIGAPRGETVLVSGLYGPGCLRLTSPELVAFLAALSGEAPAGEPSATRG